jgi:hypothetical protein
MDHIYLIGNGFDLAHGLETRYSDFILWYINKAWTLFLNKCRILNIASHNDGLLKIETTNPDILLSSNFPSKFGSITEFQKFTLEATYPQISRVSDNRIMLNNIRIFPSTLLHAILEKDGWSDIEKEYYLCLKQAFSSKEKAKEIKELNKSLDTIKSELKLYLTTVIEPLISKSLTNDKIATMLNDCPSSDYQLFINFNYTRVLEKLYFNNLGSLQKIVNIHGSIDSNEDPFIFGYGDDHDPLIRELIDSEIDGALDNLKQYSYDEADIYKKILQFVSRSDNYKLHIMGHSLGISDRYLLSRLISRKNCVEIEIHYHKTLHGDNFRTLNQNLERLRINRSNTNIITKPHSTHFPSAN